VAVAAAVTAMNDKDSVQWQQWWGCLMVVEASDSIQWQW
jgi:hypothetical protein